MVLLCGLYNSFCVPVLNPGFTTIACITLPSGNSFEFASEIIAPLAIVLIIVSQVSVKVLNTSAEFPVIKYSPPATYKFPLGKT